MMQVRKQTGNSVAIPVVHAIAKRMSNVLQPRYINEELPETLSGEIA